MAYTKAWLPDTRWNMPVPANNRYRAVLPSLLRRLRSAYGGEGGLVGRKREAREEGGSRSGRETMVEVNRDTRQYSVHWIDRRRCHRAKKLFIRDAIRFHDEIYYGLSRPFLISENFEFPEWKCLERIWLILWAKEASSVMHACGSGSNEGFKRPSWRWLSREEQPLHSEPLPLDRACKWMGASRGCQSAGAVL